MPTTVLILFLLVFFVGGAAGYYLRLLLALQKRNSMELEIKKMTLAAKETARNIIEESERKAAKKEEEIKQAEEKKEAIFQKTEDRLIRKEEILDQRQINIDQEEGELKKKNEEAEKLREEAARQKKESRKNLERVASLSVEEAKAELLESVERQYQEDLITRLRKLESAGLAQIETKAKDILLNAIQRFGNSVAPEVLTTVVAIPNEDAKGKIIGKEGRNIRSFEKMAGVELIVDDTPGVVTISAFDPVRRRIAKQALESLIADGRIQPAKIESHIEKAKKEISKTIQQKGEAAAFECGVLNLHPGLLAILGRLAFRTSYGQNVLQHSVEMAHIAGIIASEVGADVQVARAGALLHDIGKAVDHEVQGTHVEIGRRILQKFGVNKAVIQAMQSHHEEYPYETPESVIVQVADAISGGRPGARKDSAENYLKRLTELEALANSFTGVERSYALQAGREIRIFVSPENLSDLEAQHLAREIAIRVEEELKYPGEIKISVTRETRYIEYAR
ncbi:MAG TPA: ribonuclease Y [Candidatus Paceibacterota bacterium]|nr:ribonuclease Y [Candidatus Paceibacterota bacterium]